MKYRLIIAPSAQREIKKLPFEIREHIGARITALRDNPRPPDYKKLKGSDEYRIRVGDYRVIYTIQDDIVTVTITRAAHRREVYR